MFSLPFAITLNRFTRRMALERLRNWRTGYPVLNGRFRDASGRGPRHTFFYPVEQYQQEHLEILAELCAETGSEIEVHLHHDGDTEETLRQQIERGLENLTRHGALSMDTAGRLRFGFVHGNWALANSRPDGRWCGVPNELGLLRELGCYADFTFPSAPSDTQPRSVNSIGYARESGSPRGLDHLVHAARGKTGTLREDTNHLLLIQGPLALNWGRRKWGMLPRLENADLTRANPPTPLRTRLWLSQHIHVTGQSDWIFIKLHSHGAVPANAEVLRGEAAHAFHEDFTVHLPREAGIRTHYVTAREMANLVHAAEDGHSGDPSRFLDHVYRRRS